MLNLNVNGVIYRYPQPGDVDWGQGATNWAVAVTTGMLQKAGGSFVLTADVDFGANFGLYSLFFASRTSNMADDGAVRLAASDFIAFRNQANSANLNLSLNLSDQLTFNGVVIQGEVSVSDTSTIDLTLTGATLSADIVNSSITNAMINSSAAIAYSKLNLTGSIVNADVNNAAAIDWSKLAAGTTGRAIITDPSTGVISVSTVTSTELGYSSGVTSSIQTQLNAKLNLSGGTMSGPLLLAGAPTLSNEAATKQYVDNAMLGLSVKDPVVAATTGPGNLATDFEDGESLDSVTLATGDRILIKDQADPTENGIYVVAASGAPSRSSDADTWAELVQAYILVLQGAVNSATGWLCTIAPGGTLGVDPVTWAQFSSSISLTTDNEGLVIAGNQISMVLDGTTLSKSVSGLKVNEILDANVASNAAIAYSKLAALTVNRALHSNGSGTVTVSSVTSTELGYLGGVTSAIQTQLDSKLPITLTTTGDMIYSSSGATPARLPIGTSNQVLHVVGGVPSWQNINYNPTVVAGSTGATLTSADSNKVYIVNTSSSRTFNLPAPAAGLNFTIKDGTGQANTNAISLVRNASEQIEGIAATKLLQTNWGSWKVISDGTNWFLI